MGWAPEDGIVIIDSILAEGVVSYCQLGVGFDVLLT